MRLRILLVLSAVLVLTVTALAWLYESHVRLQDLKRQAEESLSLKRSGVVAEIERFRYLPIVIGQDERVQRQLDAPTDPQLLDAANRYLELVNREGKSNKLYLLNSEGICLSSSNWQEPKSFVGKSYAVRPYFRDAMESGQGHHYGIGITTGEPGYYMSQRIDTGGKHVGVAVVKVDLSGLEKSWMTAGEQVALVDDAGMIILSSVEGWKFRPVVPLSDEVRKRLHDSQLYLDQQVNAPPPLSHLPDASEDAYVEIKGSRMLLQFMQIPSEGWMILAAYDVAPVYVSANLVAAIVFLGSSLLFVLGFYLFERRQRGRANQIREILENMSAGIAVFDADLCLVAWNNQYVVLNSFPPSLVRVGCPFADIIKYNVARGDYGPGDPQKQLQERIDRARQQLNRQLEVRRPDGTWVNIRRSRMPNGTLIQVYTDVTERKNAEAELEAHRSNLESLVERRTAELKQLNDRLRQAVEQMEIAKGQAEEADRAKTSFLNSVSHDIRNPLNAILGYAGLVLANSRQSLPDKQYQNLEKLAAKGRELNDLVQSFLDYSRADQVELGRVALAPLIRDCLATIEPSVDAERVRLLSDVPADLPSLMQDREKLRRAIYNLLSNAAKFTERGTIRIAAVRRDDLIEVSVADTGRGIPEGGRDRIFEEFVRVETRGERPREGAGLGLAICRRFAQLMGGDVTVQSRIGEGSTFTLSIPITHPKAAVNGEGHPEAEAAPIGGRAKTVGANGGPRVLIVDDSKENRDFLTQLLEQRYQLLTAEDGKKAIEIVRREQPDLVLMDLSLPIVDGWEATRIIKSDPRLRSIPIIAVTAHATAQDRDEVKAAGCDDFFAKPVDEKALLDAIERYLRAQ